MAKQNTADPHDENVEKVLNAVEVTIANRPAIFTAMFHLCWWKDELKCLPCNHTCEDHEIFGRYTDSTLNAGFTAAQWYNLGIRIGIFLKEIKT